MAETILATVACVSFIAGGYYLHKAFKARDGERTQATARVEFELRLIASTLIALAFVVALAV